MKFFLIAICSLSITFSAFSQQRPKKPGNKASYDVSGLVIEKSSNTPLEFATIILKPINSDQVFGGLTNEKGKFKVSVPQGTYNISIEFISFKTINFPNKIVNNDLDLGRIIIEEDAQALDEVEIIAEKSTVEIKLDKKIYNVGKDMTVKGGTASDVLDNVPSVTVDTEGAVSLRGNENVRILINGKPSGLVGLNDTEALRQFPAESIKKVEVITSPSARYDAEGTAGIINIILRRGEAQGFNGSVTLNGGIPEFYGGSTSLNYRLEKVNFFTNIGYSHREAPGNAQFKTIYFSPTASNPFVNEDREYQRVRNNLNVNFGFEYFISDKTSFVTSILYRDGNNGSVSTNITDAFDANMVLDYTSLRIEDEDEDDKVYQYSFNFTHDFNEEGHKLTADFQYESNSELEESLITNEETYPLPIDNLSESVISDEDQKKILLQADYVLPIGENQQFEAGYRSNINDLTTDYRLYNENVDGDFILNPKVSNIFVYDENIHALYSQYGNKFGKFSALLGLRMEVTDIDIEIKDENLDAKKNYTNFFPTANLAYELNESENFTLGYNRRISRPRSRFINPFPSQSSKSNIFQGNPDLDPSISDGLDLGYFKRWAKVTFNTSIYYNYATDVFQFISEDTGEITDEGIPIIRRTPINLATEQRIGYEFSVNYTPIRKWRFNASFNLYNSKRDGEYNGVDYGAKNTSWFTRFSSKIVLPAEIDWQTTMMYRGPSEDAQNKRDGMFMMNMALSKDILKGNGTISFNVDDLFNSRKREMETLTDDFAQESAFQWRERQFRVSFAYRFNQKKKRERPRNGGFDGGGDEGFGG